MLNISKKMSTVVYSVTSETRDRIYNDVELTYSILSNNNLDKNYLKF